MNKKTYDENRHSEKTKNPFIKQIERIRLFIANYLNETGSPTFDDDKSCDNAYIKSKNFFKWLGCFFVGIALSILAFLIFWFIFATPIVVVVSFFEMLATLSGSAAGNFLFAEMYSDVLILCFKVMPVSLYMIICGGIILVLNRTKNKNRNKKQTMNKKAYVFLSVTICCSVFCIFKFGIEEPYVLGDIAYNENTKHGYTIYLSENSEFVPYLVLDNNYSGKNDVILLRKYVLDNPMFISEDENGNYSDSIMDVYLNIDFLNSLDIKDNILTTDVICWIGPYESYLTLQKQVFLLSTKEIGDSTFANEGKELEFFTKALNRRNAFKESGEEATWWLRSSSMSNSDESAFVSIYGSIYFTQDYPCGVEIFEHRQDVRPAFCLSADTPICKQVVDGEEVYVIAEK